MIERKKMGYYFHDKLSFSGIVCNCVYNLWWEKWSSPSGKSDGLKTWMSNKGIIQTWRHSRFNSRHHTFYVAASGFQGDEKLWA